MTELIIDPPVSPFASLAKLNAWRGELLAMRTEHEGDPRALRTVLEAIEQVDGWIALAKGRP